MKSSHKLLEFLKPWEGCKLAPYLDVGGRWSIGIGHLYKSGETMKPITVKEALDILAVDLRVAEKAVENLVDVPMEQHQFDCFTSVSFNIGTGAFATSHFLQYFNEGKPHLCADAILNWNHVNGQVSQGLTNRRKAEREMFLTGIYQENV